MKTKNKIQMFVSVVACLFSMIFAGQIQTDFGKVEMNEVSIVTEAGTLTGYEFKPKAATSEHPAPAVVCSHGYLNNREMQDCNYVELARRGYVVLAMNAYGHGDSEVAKEGYESTAYVRSGGMIPFVEYISNLDYVDKEKIGCTGHSMGGGYTITTMTYYTELEEKALAEGKSKEEAHKLNKINTGVIVGNYPTAMAKETNGRHFLCHCNVIAAKYDEFFAANAAVLLTSDNTKNLIYNLTGTTITEAEEGHTYKGKDGYTVTLYNPAQYHATNHFSVKVVKSLIESFERTMPAPVKIDANKQTWVWKEIFNCLGLIGFFSFIVPFVDFLLQFKAFEEVKREVVTYELTNKKKYVTNNILNGVIDFVIILPTMLVGYLLLINKFWPQDTTGGIGIWCVGSALVTLGFVKKDFGKKLKGNTEELGTKIGKKAFLKTLLLALITVVATYSILFICDSINQTDFRIWSFDIRVFNAPKVWVAIKYLPLYAGFYIVQALAVSRSTFKNWSEHKQIIICGLFNIIAPALMLLITYGPTKIFEATLWVHLFSGGLELLVSAFALIPILMIPFVPILFITSAISVKTYRLSGNIWVGAIINALLVTMITVANTSYSFPY